MSRDLRRLRYSGLVVLVCALLALTPGAALASGKKDNHCITPAGEDVNAFYASGDAFITPFCTVAHTGDKWRPLLRIQVAGTDPVYPPGYVPSRPTPLQDFLAKFVSGRYVVDPGTARERSYAFAPKDLAVRTGTLPDGTQFVRWTPRLHPLPPGDHVVDEYGTLSADFWDGLGTDPAVNLLPAGESLANSVQFTVVNHGAK